MADILTNIHNKLPTLSKGKQRIARYLLEFCEQAAFQTAGVIGKTVQVSESTVVRFATDLGYDGYPELQKALQELVRHRLSHGQPAAQRPAVNEDLITSVVRGDVQQLRCTMEHLDRRAFQGAVEALLKARKIYLLGVQEDAPLAMLLHRYLQDAFSEVCCITQGDGREILRRLVHLTSRDVLLSINACSHAPVVRKALEFAQQTGAQTVALSDGSDASADYVLAVECHSLAFGGSMAAPLAVVNALLVAVNAGRKQETAETLERLEEIWDVYHV